LIPFERIRIVCEKGGPNYRHGGTSYPGRPSKRGAPNAFCPVCFLKKHWEITSRQGIGTISAEERRETSKGGTVLALAVKD